MSARGYLQTLGAGETITLPAGRYFYVKTAPSALDITALGNTASPAQFLGVPAGSKFGPVAEGQGWSRLQITSAAAQSIEIIISDDGLFEVANAVTLVGTSAVIDVAATAAITSVNCADASQTVLFAANLARRRMTVWAEVAGAGAFFRTTGGATSGMAVRSGVAYTFEGTYGMDIRNDSGASINFRCFQET